MEKLNYGIYKLILKSLYNGCIISSQNLKHKSAVCAITSCIFEDKEFLLCGDYDGKVSIWEITELKASLNAY